MKNFSLKFFGVAFALIATSCADDSTITNVEESQASALGVHKVTIKATPSAEARVSFYNHTMLSFDSWTEFEETVTSLENQVDTADDRFLTGTDNMTDDELVTYEDQLGYNVDQPLIDFENSLGFTNSYRITYDRQEQIFLADDVLDDTKDPDLKTLFSNEELSLLNDNQEVMVAGEIYKFSVDGYAVYNTSYVQTASFSTSTAERGSCKTWKKSYSYVTYATGKKVKRIAGIRSIPLYCKSHAKIISYVKRTSGWKRYRTRLCVGVQAYLYAAGKCDNVVTSAWSGYKCKRRKALSKNMTTWGGYYAAKNGVSIIGYYQYGGFSSTYALQW